MPRLLFEKTGNAVWISHLDLMRLFQRAFKRAGLPLTHTQGFNPRPSVSIALPLSVGTQSHCELLDFDLDGAAVSCEEIHQKLNNALIEGVRVLKVYENGNKIRHLSYLDCRVTFMYDKVVCQQDTEQIRALFGRTSLPVEKKGKNGVTQQDIIPMIRFLSVNRENEHTITIQARICCQNPTLNPAQLTTAVQLYLPELTPNGVTYTREEIYDTEENIFR